MVGAAAQPISMRCLTRLLHLLELPLNPASPLLVLLLLLTHIIVVIIRVGGTSRKAFPILDSSDQHSWKPHDIENATVAR